VNFKVIDANGFRLNVGIILCNDEGKLFWARRVGRNVWQFPQGGINPDESPEEALIRELREEVGLGAEHVEIVGCTRQWLRYRLPKRLVRHDALPLCIGQKQRWFALRLVGGEQHVCLNTTETPEFDHWKWVTYWHPLREVAAFKRKVYERALRELRPMINPRGTRRAPPDTTRIQRAEP
jgi:putative (di)nucleoside polyphosphate hydrolase